MLRIENREGGGGGGGGGLEYNLCVIYKARHSAKVASNHMILESH